MTRHEVAQTVSSQLFLDFREFGGETLKSPGSDLLRLASAQGDLACVELAGNRASTTVMLNCILKCSKSDSGT